MTAISVSDALDEVTASLPHAETRPGQRQMALAVAEAIDEGHHLIVQAGTGTGKTIAYLVPVILSGRRTVVATATKALQDQLANKDLPSVIEGLAPLIGRHPTFAVLKGRSNYVCRQRLAEIANASSATSPTLELEDVSAFTKREIDRIRNWAASSPTGDVAELDWSPSWGAWSAVSVDSDECPGARRCPLGGVCFAENARAAASEADVIVVNTHLYSMHVASRGVLLPEHDILVLDEAHNLEDIVSESIRLSFSAGRFNSFAGVVRRIIDDPKLISDIVAIGTHLTSVIAPMLERRIDVDQGNGKHGLPVEVFAVLANAQRVVSEVNAALAKIDPSDKPGTSPTSDDVKQRKLRAETTANRLFESLTLAAAADERFVSFVTGKADNPELKIVPLEVGPALSEGVWGEVTAILTSATVPSNMPTRVGLPINRTRGLDVESPFDYESNSLLYCAKHLPEPRQAQFQPLMHDELARLVTAAGGRTLALFTSYNAMNLAADVLRTRIGFPVLVQGEHPKNELLRRFSESEESCLFATAGFFQGIDIPGRTLSLVTIDKIPFPRPDDPLLGARRDAVGKEWFGEIDLPRAATLLAQAAGRLIRNASDRGVVAVFDSRLAKAGYRQRILAALPPMRRTIDIDEVADFLAMIGRD